MYYKVLVPFEYGVVTTTHTGKIYNPITPVFVEVKISRDGRLSMTGVIGPKSNGDARGGCGQIYDEIERVINGDEPVHYCPGWNKRLVEFMLYLWKRWHLNDMRAGCPHQEAGKRHMQSIAPYHFRFPKLEPRERLVSWMTITERFFNVSNLNTIYEVPLFKKCRRCNYRYGSAWLYEELPDGIVSEFESMPTAARTLPEAWASSYKRR